jgi:hypothetical protein
LHENGNEEPFPHTQLALEALTRIFQEIILRNPMCEKAHEVPPYRAYILYIGAVLLIQVGDRLDRSQWKAQVEQVKEHLKLSRTKWRVAG